MRISFIFIGGVLILVGVAVFLGFSGVKEYKRVSAIDREIAVLASEADRLERTNADLEERISYFSSDTYRERLAKERLGYKRKDEKVVVIAQMQDDVTNKEKEVFFEEKPSIIAPVRGWIEQLFSDKQVIY